MSRLRTALIIFSSFLPFTAEASLSINFTFESGLTPSQQAIFNEAKATWEGSITHEIDLVLDIGTLWDPGYNDIYVDGSSDYPGVFALGAYQDEFNPLATYIIPVEPGSGESTEISDQDGLNMANEPTTGWIGGDPDDIFISNTTLGTIQDLGFTVNMPIPEPGPGLMAGLALMWAGQIRRRPKMG